MTLILGLLCGEGLVLISDGQATIGTSGQPLKAPVQKLHTNWTNVAWGAAGLVGVKQLVDQELHKVLTKPTELEKRSKASARQSLTRAVSTALRSSSELYVSWKDGKNQDPSGSLLFAGYATDGPFLLEVNHNALDADHTDQGYCAIGSGDIFPYFALAGLAHYQVRQRSLLEAKLVAYRVVSDAISVAAYALGEPIQMVEIPKPESGKVAAAHTLTDDELRVIADKVAEWKLVECESLTELVGMSSPAGKCL